MYTSIRMATRPTTAEDRGAPATHEPTCDRRMFDALVERHWDAVVRFLWLRSSGEEALDMAQEVFLRAWRAARSGGGPVEPTPVLWRTYLLRSARHLWIDACRRRGVRIEATSLEGLLGEESGREELAIADEPRDFDQAEALVEKETRTALVDCMSRLRTELRQIFWLHFVEGCSKREIARGLECPESTLRLDMARGMRELRLCLKTKGVAPEVCG